MCNTHLDRNQKRPVAIGGATEARFTAWEPAPKKPAATGKGKLADAIRCAAQNHVVSDSLELCIVIGAATPPRKFLAARRHSSAELKEPKECADVKCHA
jgi:hypothetical protein